MRKSLAGLVLGSSLAMQGCGAIIAGALVADAIEAPSRNQHITEIENANRQSLSNEELLATYPCANTIFSQFGENGGGNLYVYQNTLYFEGKRGAYAKIPLGNINSVEFVDELFNDWITISTKGSAQWGTKGESYSFDLTNSSSERQAAAALSNWAFGR